MSVTVTRKAAIVTLLLMLSTSAALAAETITIDFERFPGPDGVLGTADDTLPTCVFIPEGIPNLPCEPLGDQFTSMGITFTSGFIFQFSDPLFPGSSPPNHFVGSSPAAATFSIPVFGISIMASLFWSPTLYTLDEAGNVIASNTLTPGAGVFGTLSVSTSTPIRQFVVLAAGCTVAGGGCDQITVVDNLVLTVMPSVTPVEIDIKPKQVQNSINTRAHGRIRVAILSTSSFDARDVDPTTVRFGPTGEEAAAVHWASADVNHDGDTDLVLQFRTGIPASLVAMLRRGSQGARWPAS